MAVEELRENWTRYVTDEGDDGTKMWQLRDGVPENVSPSSLPIVVVIDWQYADAGLPDSATLERLHEFESRIDSLNNPAGNCLRAHIIRGCGKSEIAYYVREYDQFIDDFNAVLAGALNYPIEIEYFSDPEWKYWHSIPENF
jgi:hypothetical protein